MTDLEKKIESVEDRLNIRLASLEERLNLCIGYRTTTVLREFDTIKDYLRDIQQHLVIKTLLEGKEKK